MRSLLLFIILLLPVPVIYAQKTAPVQLIGSDQQGYDYGSIGVGDNPQLVIPVVNTGTTLLTINTITGDQDNIKFSWAKKKIKPGKKVYVYATFYPKDPSATGSFKTEVLMSFADNGGAYSFTIRGTIVPGKGAPDQQKSQSKSRGGRGGRGG